ncbi:MAG TPA: ATP-binding cassette domain-containing protein [Burkholderiaceae bacterium]|nr:ATP-binding cassette domain-containing protein [Burkholderiaceae bacterium]
MALVSVLDARLGFGAGWLLDGAACAIELGERVGLVGRNGTGKSSLLKAIAGDIALDGGEIVRRAGLRVGFLPQEPEFAAGLTVFSAVAAGLEASALIAEHDAAMQAAHEAHDTAAQTRLQRAHDAMDAADAWATAHRVHALIDRMGLDAHAEVARLSGGQQRRAALARALVAEPELLLLDEPTNHLDVSAIVALEELLRGLPIALMFVTHDRAFLDRVATRILELDRGKLRSYPGSFSAYQSLKAQQLEAEAVERAKADKLLAQEEAWIRRGVEARRTRSVSRIERLQQMRREHAQRRAVQGRVNLRVDSGDTSGKRVAELEHVGKSYGERVLVRDLDLVVQRGDKLALVGDNGTGKTTLLRLILGTLAPDTGRIKLGTNLQVAYFDQMRAALDPNASVRETISPGSDWIEINGQRKHVMAYLNDFLFAPERANSPVRSLSGGERNRLLLARLLARPANVLVLDEPTNDLDIETLELLEELLLDFDGTLLLVSHDRMFIDRVATQVLMAEGDGRWSEYVGGYTDAQAARARTAAPPPALARADDKTTESVATTRPARARVKLGYLEQRELEALPERIAELETEQSDLQKLLANPDTYVSGAHDIGRLTNRLDEVSAALDTAITRWTELEDRAQAARSV